MHSILVPLLGTGQPFLGVFLVMMLFERVDDQLLMHWLPMMLMRFASLLTNKVSAPVL
jgi:hypothetical protein